MQNWVYQVAFFCSEAAMKVSSSYLTSVVVGKDIVPRIGLAQLETLRLQLMEEIRQSNRSKVRAI